MRTGLSEGIKTDRVVVRCWRAGPSATVAPARGAPVTCYEVLDTPPDWGAVAQPEPMYRFDQCTPGKGRRGTPGRCCEANCAQRVPFRDERALSIPSTGEGAALSARFDLILGGEGTRAA